MLRALARSLQLRLAEECTQSVQQCARMAPGQTLAAPQIARRVQTQVCDRTVWRHHNGLQESMNYL